MGILALIRGTTISLNQERLIVKMNSQIILVRLEKKTPQCHKDKDRIFHYKKFCVYSAVIVRFP